MNTKYLFLLAALTFLVSACAPTATPQAMMEKPTEAMQKPAEAMMDESTDDTMPHDATATPETMMEDKMMDSPAWFSATLTNVRTGENFTINDFKDKVVLVETLAMWCPNCKQQQLQLQDLHKMLDMMGENLVSIGLDIDPNENAADLKDYTEANGFDWIYAVAPADVTREIGQLYGEQFLNPSSTPILVIDHEGQVHPMPFGVKSADELKTFIEPIINTGM